MKALVLAAPSRLEYRDVDDPQLAAGEVRVRVKACGICGSDVHGMDGSTGRRRPPVIMGHEAAGVIAEVARDVSRWRVGDRVTFDSTVYCGECWFCRRGRINLCEGRRVLGVSCEEYRRDGAFAEYVAVPAHILYRLPEGLGFEQAAMVEALSIAFHAVDRTPVALGDAAVVVGAGVIGLLAVQALRAAGCGRIVAVDVDAGRCVLARRLGADEAFDPREADVADEVARRTGGRGADVVVEAVGLAETVRLAVACARKGGALTLVGNLAPAVELPLQAVVTRELALAGSCASCGEYAACLEMLARGAVQVEPLISATAPLAEGAEWFRKLYERQGGLVKVVLVP